MTKNPLHTPQVRAQELAYRQLLIQAREAGDTHNAAMIVAMLQALPAEVIPGRAWGRNAKRR